LFKNWKGQEKRYVTGIITHTARVKFNSHPVSLFQYRYGLPNGAEKWKNARRSMADFDVYEMLGELMQSKFEAFKEGGKDEKAAKL
jgi:hypothetical protein